MAARTDAERRPGPESGSGGAGAEAGEALSPVKRALLEVRRLRSALDAADRAAREPIAIIGMGCRLPGGCDGPAALWRALVEGRDCITEVPPDRWDADAFFDEDPGRPGRITTRFGGFIDGVDRFDPGFFGISPLEAMGMDPQQRLLLEVAWEALEHACLAPDRLAGSATGVFVGVGGVDYVEKVLARPLEAYNPFVAQGVAHAASSGRLAYALGLQGPAVSLDTACSSSLLAVHLAVQSLRHGECRMALAGGVNVMLSPNMHVALSRARMLAPDGRCKTFDARADGFIRSEGCGVVVLKRLDDALADGDAVWAVIRGSATNQDGRSSGMTAPNGPAQETVIRAALANAGLAPADVAYVEAHGTGTELGDPIEVQALGRVLGEGRDPSNRLRIGSIKTNLGHLEAAAGVAGLIKAALVLRHGEIPPHLHLRTPNPHIPWADLPIDVPTTASPLRPDGGRAVAGVSSFGFTGSNVHVVLETPPEPEPADPARPVHALKVTARHAAALEDLAAHYASALPESERDFAAACCASTTGRADLPHRLVVVAETPAEARAALAAWRAGEDVTDRGVFHGQAVDAEPPEVGFLFTGHGAQFVGMGRRLAESEPVFRAALEECDALLRPHLAEPLLSVLHPADGAGDVAARRLETMTYGQPALFAIEYAFARLWRAWGVEPTAVLGHSVGEYAAACIAGVFGLEDGLKLVAARGRLMDSLPETGAMAALFAGEADARSLIRPREAEVSIAAINGPTETVVSGTRSAVEAVLADAGRQGIEFRRLAVAAAAHSPLLDPILDAFEETAATVRFSRPELDLVSCTFARPVTADEVGRSDYWRRHLREPVRFADALACLHGMGPRVFIEVGPDPRLCGIGARALPDADASWLPSMRQDRDEWRQLLESLGVAYARGVAVDWAAFERGAADPEGRPRRKAPLPTYAWRHRRYWIESDPGAGGDRAPSARPGVRASAAEVWAAAVAAGRLQEAHGPLDLNLPLFAERWTTLDRLTTAIVADTLRRMDAFPDTSAPRTAESLVAGLGVLPGYTGLVARWLRRLAEAGRLRPADGGFVLAGPLGEAGLDDAWADADAVLGEDGRFLGDYLRRCQAMLPDVLRGGVNPLETLFPGGSTETAEMLYRDWSVVRYHNQILRAVLAEVARDRPGGRPVRVLELGGGTGGTTSALLPALAGRAAEYRFTDVSELFLAQASERFAAYPFLTCGILDIDEDPEAQGYEPGTYDVVVAANVLHAARDVPRTLARVRSLLAPGGVLLAFEITDYLSWFDVSTSLLEGWENYVDGIRREHPLLAATDWDAQIRSAGFERLTRFPADDSPARVLGLHVFLAQVPGEIVATADAGGVDAADAGPAPGREDATSPDAAAAGVAGTPAGEAAAAFRREVEAASAVERTELLAGFVRREIVRMLRLDASEPIDRKRRLLDLGLDSLMAVELRGRLGRGLALDEPLPATLVFDHPTIDAIVSLLAHRLGDGAPGTDRPVAGHEGGDEAAATAEIEALSDDEAEARLLARLDALEELER